MQKIPAAEKEVFMLKWAPGLHKDSKWEIAIGNVSFLSLICIIFYVHSCSQESFAGHWRT